MHTCRFLLTAFLVAMFVGCGMDVIQVEGDSPGECGDGIDNDNNGSTDCFDLRCIEAPECDFRFELTEANVDLSCSEPYWRVELAKIDKSCSTLFDECVRVQCQYESRSDSTSSTEVSSFYSADGKQLEKKTDLTLGPGQKKVVSFDYSDASAGDENARGGCRLKRDRCARVECTVTNTGNVAATARIKTTYDRGGVSPKTLSVNLAAGQTRSVVHDFKLPDDSATGGTGRCKLERQKLLP
jgi:hypothetical protein